MRAWNNRHGDELWLVQGLEAEILEDGSLDLPRAARSGVLLVAAVHTGLAERRDQTGRLLRAIEEPGVWALAHPRGHLFARRPGVRANWEVVFRAAAAAGVLIEINGFPAGRSRPRVARRGARRRVPVPARVRRAPCAAPRLRGDGGRAGDPGRRAGERDRQLRAARPPRRDAAGPRTPLSNRRRRERYDGKGQTEGEDQHDPRGCRRAPRFSSTAFRSTLFRRPQSSPANRSVEM